MNGTFYPRLIVVSGPSGVGKSTIIKEVLSQLPYIKLSVSSTTRKPRPGEVDGKDYFFIDKREFERKIAKHAFLEWARVYDNYYGTSKEHVMQTLGTQHHVLLDVDTQGATAIRRSCSGAVMIFIKPPALQDLRRRLAGRGTESPESLEKRLSWSAHEIDQAKYYDHIVINHTVPEAVAQFVGIIQQAEHQQIPFLIHQDKLEQVRALKSGSDHGLLPDDEEERPPSTAPARSVRAVASADAEADAPAAGDAQPVTVVELTADEIDPLDAAGPDDSAEPLPRVPRATTLPRRHPRPDEQALVRQLVQRIRPMLTDELVEQVRARVRETLKRDLQRVLRETYQSIRSQRG